MNGHPCPDWLKKKLSILYWKRYKNKQTKKICIVCKHEFFVSKVHANKRKCCSVKCKNIFQKGKPTWNKGIVWEQMRGQGNPNYKNGTLRKERHVLMERNEYKQWRKQVFEKDNYICQMCNKHRTILHADHIDGWGKFPKLRFEVNNGRTLCVDCHFFITFGKNRPPESRWGIN